MMTNCLHYKDYARDAIKLAVQKLEGGVVDGKRGGGGPPVEMWPRAPSNLKTALGLLHIAAGAERFGTLENCSYFPFENKLKSIKKLVRKPQLPLQQVVGRVLEQKRTGSRIVDPNSSSDVKPQLLREHWRGPLPAECVGAKQFSQILLSNMSYFCVNVCLYVFVCACMCVCMYVCMCVCLLVCVFVCVCICLYVCVSACIRVAQKTKVAILTLNLSLFSK